VSYALYRWDRSVARPTEAPDYMTDEDVKMFFNTEWEISHNASQLGIRLVGPKPKFTRSDGGEGGSHPSHLHDNACVYISYFAVWLVACHRTFHLSYIDVLLRRDWINKLHWRLTSRTNLGWPISWRIHLSVYSVCLWDLGGIGSNSRSSDVCKLAQITTIWSHISLWRIVGCAVSMKPWVTVNWWTQL